jgi:hypothetical protein
MKIGKRLTHQTPPPPRISPRPPHTWTMEARHPTSKIYPRRRRLWYKVRGKGACGPFTPGTQEGICSHRRLDRGSILLNHVRLELQSGNSGPIDTRVRRRSPTQVPTQTTYPTGERTLSCMRKTVWGQSPTHARTGYLRRLVSRWKETDPEGFRIVTLL